MFYILEAKKEQLKENEPLNRRVFKDLRDNTFLEWIYNWNKCEENTLSLAETKTVLSGITVGGKTIKEHLRISNYQKALFYLDDIIKKDEPFTQVQIKTLHSILEKGEFDKNYSNYRNRNTDIAGLKYTYTKYTKIKEEMANFVEWYNIKKENENLIVRAVLVQTIFLMIQPFPEQNIRTSELLLNLELMRNGYPPIVIKSKNKQAYHQALDRACMYGNNGELVQVITLELKETLDRYLELI